MRCFAPHLLFGFLLRELQGKNDLYKPQNMAAGYARRHILGFNYFLQAPQSNTTVLSPKSEFADCP
jgi:hypothetical protein